MAPDHHNNWNRCVLYLLKRCSWSFLLSIQFQIFLSAPVILEKSTGLMLLTDMMPASDGRTCRIVPPIHFLSFKVGERIISCGHKRNEPCWKCRSIRWQISKKCMLQPIIVTLKDSESAHYWFEHFPKDHLAKIYLCGNIDWSKRSHGYKQINVLFIVSSVGRNIIK